MEESRERQRKENVGLKRNMSDESHEKYTVSKANEQLRTQVRKAEQERISLKVILKTYRKIIVIFPHQD